MPVRAKRPARRRNATDAPASDSMVRMLLELDSIPRPDDAADALAIAITDIHSAQFADLSD